MLIAYRPPIAVMLACVAPELSPYDAAQLTVQLLPQAQGHGLGVADITSASVRATAANGLRAGRKF